MAVDAHPLSLFSDICTRASSRTLYSYIGETTSDEEEEEVIYQFTFHQSWPSTGLRVAHPSRAAVGYTLYTCIMYIYFIPSRTSIYIYIYIYESTAYIIIIFMCMVALHCSTPSHWFDLPRRFVHVSRRISGPARGHYHKVNDDGAHQRRNVSICSRTLQRQPAGGLLVL